MVEGDVTREEWTMIKYMANLENLGYTHKPTTFRHFSKLPQELQNSVWCFVVMNLANDFRNETRINIEIRGELVSSHLCFAAPSKGPAILPAIASFVKGTGRKALAPPVLLSLELAAEFVITI
jgi:hypothetical protein